MNFSLAIFFVTFSVLYLSLSITDDLPSVMMTLALGDFTSSLVISNALNLINLSVREEFNISCDFLIPSDSISNRSVSFFCFSIINSSAIRCFETSNSASFSPSQSGN